MLLVNVSESEDTASRPRTPIMNIPPPSPAKADPSPRRKLLEIGPPELVPIPKVENRPLPTFDFNPDTLIDVDGVYFRVHSSVLRSQSKVLDSLLWREEAAVISLFI